MNELRCTFEGISLGLNEASFYPVFFCSGFVESQSEELALCAVYHTSHCTLWGWPL